MTRTPMDDPTLLQTSDSERQDIETHCAPELGIGALVGRFTLQRLRARGGFGCVYRAQAPGDPEAVAVKVLHSTLAGSAVALRRFEQEARAIRRVRHQAIVELLDYGSLPDGRPYLVTEWVEGETLDDVLRHGPIELPVAVAIAERLGAALDAAHGSGIVHRDLKGANIMITPAVRGAVPGVKLLDFGIAKLLDSDEQLTRTYVRLGTPHYMAPEQISGEEVGPTADIYSFAVVVFHMVTGRLPFCGGSIAEIEGSHLHDSPPRASDLADVPEPVADVLIRGLAKQPSDRFSSAGELARELALAARRDGKVPQRFRVHERLRVGVYVTRSQESEPTARAFDAARAECTRAGLEILPVDSDAFLAHTPLPDSGGLARDLRSRTIQLALRITGQNELRSTVHVARATELVVRGVFKLSGGDLCDVQSWAVDSGPSVHVTAPALEGIAPAAGTR